MTRNVSDWERVASVAAGAALLYLATRQRPGKPSCHLDWSGTGRARHWGILPSQRRRGPKR